ncbi:hypothetical protein AOLI_G00314010 [Acnodon oligacanthus]
MQVSPGAKHGTVPQPNLATGTHSPTSGQSEKSRSSPPPKPKVELFGKHQVVVMERFSNSPPSESYFKSQEPRRTALEQESQASVMELTAMSDT